MSESFDMDQLKLVIRLRNLAGYMGRALKLDDTRIIVLPQMAADLKQAAALVEKLCIPRKRRKKS